ncbi:MAG: AMP-binding protein [Nocardioides sp.]|uniref:class I adenylate-forming enzyme family protein n=1 Tax=Nocardioides sp. TaxID=35761 RepID=UPI0039E2152B
MSSFDDLVEKPVPLVETFVDDRDIAQILYTSGTTSRPKAVMASHIAVEISALSTAVQFGHVRGDDYSVFPIVLPLFHVTALNSLTLPVLFTGGTVVLHRGFDADALLRDLATRRVTHMLLLPIMWGAFAERAGHQSVPGGENVRMAIYAMAPMNEQRQAEVRAVLPHADIVLGSGQTEFTPPNTMQWPSHQDDKYASWGSPTMTTDVRIMAPDGSLLPPGEDGEIVYRGPQGLQGYGGEGSGRANSEQFAHGWFHSGDVGYLDDDGVVWFTDRIKDIVKTGGENVSSVEVERAMLGHPEVADCAVIGQPDDRWGERIVAVVLPAPGSTPTPDNLRAYAKEHLAGYKVPKEFVVVDQLPKTSTGKTRKDLLRKNVTA